MFKRLCVWQNATLGKSSAREFVSYFKDKGFTIKFEEEVITLPNAIDGTDSRHDIFFYISDDDIKVFKSFMPQYGIKWWRDILAHDQEHVYPSDVLEKYSRKRW